MKRCSCRAHHDRALFERDFVGQAKEAASRNVDELCVATIAMFAEHLGSGAKLLIALMAPGAVATGDQIMDTDAVALFEWCYARAAFLDRPGDFVTERQGQRPGGRASSSIMGL